MKTKKFLGKDKWQEHELNYLTLSLIRFSQASLKMVLLQASWLFFHLQVNVVVSFCNMCIAGFPNVFKKINLCKKHFRHKTNSLLSHGIKSTS